MSKRIMPAARRSALVLVYGSIALEAKVEVKSDFPGVIWDSANLAPTPNPYKELARIAPYAVTAQVKVMTKVNGKNVPADYAKLVEMLRKATFRGYLIFEYEEPEDPYVAIPLHLKKLRKLIG